VIIAVLLTALIGPFFIDWTAYRQGFEIQAERLFGHRVKVLGTADARLFPVPSLTFTDVRIGDSEAPLVTVSRFEVDIELAPLIKGEIRVLDMRLEQPDLDLTLDEDGRLSWFDDNGKSGPAMPVNPDDLSIQRLSVQGGKISLDDIAAGRRYTLDNVNFSLEARSLFGPYKIDGGVTFDGTPLTVQVGTGLYREEDGLQVKIKATTATLPVEFAFDGIVRSDEGRLAYAGSLNANRVRDEESDTMPVRAEAAFSLDASTFSATELDVTIGPDDRALRLEGETHFKFGDAPEFSADLLAKQIDLDRALGKGPADPLKVGEALERISDIVRATPSPGMPGRLSVKIPGVVVAGGLIENVGLHAISRAAGWTINSVTATLPGRTGIAAEGLFSASPEASFAGRLLIRAPQPSLLVGWLDPDSAKMGRLDPFEIDTNLHVRPGSVEVDTFSAALGEAKISGSGSWFSNGGGRPASLSLLLTADSIDLDRYLDSPGMTAFAARYVAPVAGLDSLIKITAGKIRIAAVEIEGVDINAAFSDGSLFVDRFFIENLAGTEVDANGMVEQALTTPTGSFDLSVFATDVSGLTRVLNALVPDNAVVETLRRRSSDMAPLALTGHLEAKAAAGGTEAVLDLFGDVGRTALKNTITFKGRVDGWRDADFSLNLNAKSADGGLLLRQLGFTVLPIAAPDAGALTADLSGTPDKGLRGKISLTTGLAAASYEGALSVTDQNRMVLSGTTRIETGDLGSSLLLVGKMAPILAGRIPVRLEAQTSGHPAHLVFDTVKGTFGDGPIAGSLVYDSSKSTPKLSGSLDLPAVDFRFLSELALGADAWSAIDGTAAAQWPSAAFGPPLLGGLDLDIKVAADKLLWSNDLQIANATFATRLRETELSVEGLRGTFLGGTLSGAFSIARAAGEALVSGRMRMQGAAVEDIIWKRGGRPVATGALDMAFDFEGSGRSIASIMSGLSGGGTASLHNGVLRSMNTGAFDAVIRAADAGLELDDAKIQSVFAGHLDSGSLEFDEISGSFTIASGIARARNVSVGTASATAFGGASVDLGGWSVESDWSVKVDPGANAVAGADPEVGLLFSGPLDAPTRKLDTAPLLAFLTLRTFEQEVQRVEALQAEILERDRLSRELSQRRHDIAAFEAERQRRTEDEAPGGAAIEKPEPEAAPSEPKAEVRPPKASAPQTPDKTRLSRQTESRKQKEPATFEDRIRRTLGTQSGRGRVTNRVSGANPDQPADPDSSNRSGRGLLLLSPLPPPVQLDRAPGG